MKNLKPLRTEEDHRAALGELQGLWGAKSGTARGDRLDVLATLIDVYESEHYPINVPDPIEAINAAHNPSYAFPTPRARNWRWLAPVVPTTLSGKSNRGRPVLQPPGFHQASHTSAHTRVCSPLPRNERLHPLHR